MDFVEKEVVKVEVVAGVIIEQESKYLLVQEKQPKAYGLWNLPAGKVDVGETLEEAAVREAKEETGFIVRLARKVGIFQDTAQEPVKQAFAAEIVGGELKFPKEELLDAKWFTLEELEKMGSTLRGRWVLAAIRASLVR